MTIEGCRYCGSIPASLMSLPQFTSSDWTKAASDSGGPENASKPVTAIFAFASGLAMIFCTSALRRSTMYFPPLYGARTFTLAVRTTASAAAMTGALRAAVKRIDLAQPLFDIRTMDQILENSADRPRLQTTLLTAFALLALVLGAVGVAGVVAYTVERRAPELAVRLALGSTPGQAMLRAARGGLLASGIGLAAGLATAWVFSRYWSDLLFEMYKVRPDAPAMFAAVATGLGAVSVLAAWLPARRHPAYQNFPACQ